MSEHLRREIKRLRKQIITKEFFAMICFLVLMKNGRGLNDKSPLYIQEKQEELKSGWRALGMLDSENQLKVVEYLAEWNLDLPDGLQDRDVRLVKEQFIRLNKIIGV